MEVNKVSSISSVLNLKNTGYLSLASMAVATASGFSKQKIFRKLHKPSAIVAVLSALTHLMIVLDGRRKYKSMEKLS